MPPIPNDFSSACAPRDVVVRDEGLNRLMRLQLGASTELLWSVEVPPGRDVQLVGDNRVMIGTDRGYQEHDLTDGSKTFELCSLPGALAARRFPNGITLISGAQWRGCNGVTFIELDEANAVKRQINYPDFNYVRLVRLTPKNWYSFTSNNVLLEGDATGVIHRRFELYTQLAEPHAWKTFRLADGRVLVSGGYAGNIQILKPDGSLERIITGTAAAKCNFFCDFQVMPNGNIVVVNWQGHGRNNGDKGFQLLEFTQQGLQVWHWKQNPSFVSSLQGLVVLDGLNPQRLHCEDANGVLCPL